MTQKNQSNVEARQSQILFTYLNKDIYNVTLKNDNGMTVRLSNYGGLIQSITLPDHYGNIIDVVLGFDDLRDYFTKEYLAHYPYFGAIIGRYANRIERASFPLDSEMIRLTANTPPHQLHGGFSGFDKQVWEVVSVSDFPLPKAVFKYLSHDGEEGYPGNLHVQLTYELNNSNELSYKIEARTDRATAINMTHHSYFNLNGDGSSIADHVVEIPADNYLAQDIDYVVTGEFIATKDSSHDFLSPTKISKNWKEGEGYDQAFVLNKPYGTWGKAASAYSKQTGIKLEVFTDQPGVQFYTGKYLNVTMGKKGMHYRPFTSLCLETQHHPNSVNIPAFPSTILRPGDQYLHKTTIKLTAD